MGVCRAAGTRGTSALSERGEALDDARMDERRTAAARLRTPTGLRAWTRAPDKLSTHGPEAATRPGYAATRQVMGNGGQRRTPERGDVLHGGTDHRTRRKSGGDLDRQVAVRQTQPVDQNDHGPDETGRNLTAARWPGRWTGSAEKRIRTTPTRPTAADVVALLRWRERWGAWPTTLQLVREAEK